MANQNQNQNQQGTNKGFGSGSGQQQDINKKPGQNVPGQGGFNKDQQSGNLGQKGGQNTGR